MSRPPAMKRRLIFGVDKVNYTENRPHAQARAIYIPENLTLPKQRIFQEYREDALYFIHLLFRERIFNKKHREEYIPLKQTYLRRQINQIALKPMIEALTKQGLVESDNHWLIGQKSIGYRLCPEYRAAQHHRYILTDKILLKRLDKWHQDGDCHKLEVPTHLNLKNNFRRLVLDYDAAFKDINAHYEGTLAQLKGNNSGSAYKRRLKAKLRRNYEHHHLDVWHNGDWWFSVDDHGRVHTPLTSMSSRLRKYLRLDTGESLYEIDLANSQPLIFSVLILNYFLSNHTTISSPLPSLPISLYDVTFRNYGCTPQTKRKKTRIKALLEMMRETTRIEAINTLGTVELPEDAVEYIRFCETGSLYEALQQNGMDRSQAKKMFLKTMFQKDNAPWLAQKFPTIAQVADFAKHKDYKRLSHLLQQTESRIIIQGVAERMMQENRFVATIHDSLVVGCRDVRQALHHIQQEFARCQLSPAVKVRRLTEHTTASSTASPAATLQELVNG